ncbi:MAG TPA: hypothetical protein VKT77_11415 [Chthonomonadaceae bacterium]|nr:hypothetical protein [Chthonomonadaceae bacterium]
MNRNRTGAAVLAGAGLVALGLAGLAGCDNTQGTTPQTNVAEATHRPVDDNQNNGSGAGTAEKPSSSGGGTWTDPNPSGGGSRNPYGTGKTVSGRNGST